MHIKFQKNGVTKEIKIGFSWPTLFFGWLALAIRGTAVPALITFATFGLAVLYYCFAINKIHAMQLAADGWQIADNDKTLAYLHWGIEQ